MGTRWGVSLFGFLSLGLIPIPLIFIRYGASLRERSYFVRQAQAMGAGMRGKASKDTLKELEKSGGKVLDEENGVDGAV